MRWCVKASNPRPSGPSCSSFNVPIPNTQLNIPFTHIEEEMTVPVPPADELDAYVIYIGFDPDGLKPAEKPKPVARPKAAKR